MDRTVLGGTGCAPMTQTAHTRYRATRTVRPMLTDADERSARGLYERSAVLPFTPALLGAESKIEPADRRVMDRVSWDGGLSVTTLYRTHSGLMIWQDLVGPFAWQPSLSLSGPDVRSFLLMDRAGFAFAMAQARPMVAQPSRIAFIKENPRFAVIELKVKPGTDAVVFNGSELYAVRHLDGAQQWTQLSV